MCQSRRSSTQETITSKCSSFQCLASRSAILWLSQEQQCRNLIKCFFTVQRQTHNTYVFFLSFLFHFYFILFLFWNVNMRESMSSHLSAHSIERIGRNVSEYLPLAWADSAKESSVCFSVYERKEIQCPPRVYPFMSGIFRSTIANSTSLANASVRAELKA